MKIDLMETTVILRSFLSCWLLLVCTQCNNREGKTKDRQQQTIHALVRDEEAVLDVVTADRRCCILTSPSSVSCRPVRT